MIIKMLLNINFCFVDKKEKEKEKLVNNIKNHMYINKKLNE